MPETFASAVIPSESAQAWRVVRDFGGLADWQPAVARSELRGAGPSDRVGAVRSLRMADGATVVETLVELDDDRMSLTYDIVDSPYSVHFYRATMHVFPVTSTGEAFVAWSVVFDCDPAHADDRELCRRS
ncbi:SRPBCC family protein [Amycolatopsis rhizosphaerae]|uniref:SRPBCC family protein n=1 Tax=Amycolatopsis rhizosphaerae TaxID=2053003 RepID=A0A558D6Q7_9PSEU|nr:SRPBCC family protein [Amycolatopsis rhizosphaerae]TVT56699.1 SRPBCC family protein [Amycolatopsis rhizosphaerae]